MKQYLDLANSQHLDENFSNLIGRDVPVKQVNVARGTANGTTATTHGTNFQQPTGGYLPSLPPPTAGGGSGGVPTGYVPTGYVPPSGMAQPLNGFVPHPPTNLQHTTGGYMPPPPPPDPDLPVPPSPDPYFPQPPPPVGYLPSPSPPNPYFPVEPSLPLQQAGDPVTTPVVKSQIVSAGVEKIYGIDATIVYGSLVLLGAAVGYITAKKTKKNITTYTAIGAAIGASISVVHYKFTNKGSVMPKQTAQATTSDFTGKRSRIWIRSNDPTYSNHKVGDKIGKDTLHKDGLWY